MNKTTKTLLVIGGIIGLAFITKKYWSKPKVILAEKEPNSDDGIGNTPLPINTKPIDYASRGIGWFTIKK
jgi:hypothetical protein